MKTNHITYFGIKTNRIIYFGIIVAFIAAVALVYYSGFSIHTDSFPPQSSWASGGPGGEIQLVQKGDHITGSGEMSLRRTDAGYESDFWVHGTRQTLVGKINLRGYVFESDQTDPLIFRVDRDLGYVFIRGIGTVKLINGEKISLYRPRFLWFWQK